MSASTGQVIPLVQFFTRPGAIDLAWGHPDPTLLPVEALKQASARVFDRYAADALNYGYAAGPAPLINWLCQRLAEIDGRAPAADEVLISAGTSQALDLVATLFARPSDVVLVESPTYHLAVRIFRDHPLELVPVATDEGGLRVDSLAETMQQLEASNRRPAFLYTVPTFNNPTGSCMPLDRRHQLVKLAAAESLLVIEDDAYRELAYDGPPPSSLWALGEPGTVIRLGSFAKSLAPGLRSGFVTADAATIARISDCGMLDSGGAISHFASLAIAEFAATGEYAANVERLCAAYRERRDALLAALTTEFEHIAEFQTPHGGYFVWVSLRTVRPMAEMMAAAIEQGTAFMPASAFYVHGHSAVQAIRLSFSRYPPDELREAARRLANAIRD